MSSKRTNKCRKNRNKNNMRHEDGSDTSSYYRNNRYVLAGETFRSQKRRAAEAAWQL